MQVTLEAAGHENVSARHASTFEVTTEEFLTPAGDCILGIEAPRAPASFPDGFVAACQHADATITATIEAAGTTHTITGRGDPALTFESDVSMVGRTSTYVDDRTVMVDADCAAEGIDRTLVAALEAGASLTVTLEVS